MREFKKGVQPKGKQGEGHADTGMPAPRGSPLHPGAGIRACAWTYRLPKGTESSRPPQWHLDTPHQSLTVAGAAQELRLKDFKVAHLFPV